MSTYSITITANAQTVLDALIAQSGDTASQYLTNHLESLFESLAVNELTRTQADPTYDDAVAELARDGNTMFR